MQFAFIPAREYFARLDGGMNSVELRDIKVSVPINDALTMDEVEVTIDETTYRVPLNCMYAVGTDDVDDISFLSDLCDDITRFEKICFTRKDKYTDLFDSYLMDKETPETVKTSKVRVEGFRRKVFAELVYKIAMDSGMGVYISTCKYEGYKQNFTLQRKTRGRKDKVVAKSTSLQGMFIAFKKEKHIPMKMKEEAF